MWLKINHGKAKFLKKAKDHETLNIRVNVRQANQIQKGQILLDQLRIILSQIPSNVFGSFVIVFLYLYSLRDHFTSDMQYYWRGALSFIFFLRMSVYLWSLKGNIHLQPKKWLLIYAGLMFLTGGLWGSILFIPTDLNSEVLLLTLATLLLELVCISTISSSAQPLVLWSFLTPVAMATSFALFTSAFDDFSLIFGIGALLFCLGVGYVGHSLNRMIVKSLTLQVRNASLMDEVIYMAKQNQKSYKGIQKLLDNVEAGTAMFDKDHRILSWNKSFESMFGFPIGYLKRGMGLKEVVQKMIKLSWHNNSDIETMVNVHIKDVLSSMDQEKPARLILADGRNVYNKIIQINDDQFVLNYTDVTALEQEQVENILHILHHDKLTGLPNKILLNKNINKRIEEWKSKGDKNSDDNFIALVQLGLNSLKDVNEFFGEQQGDMVIKTIAQRCKVFVSSDVLMTHNGYDEFSLVTSEFNKVDELLKLIKGLIDTVVEPIMIGSNSIIVSPVIGISTYPSHGETAEDLIRNANIAFSKAKMMNKDAVVLYEKEMHSEIVERTNLLFDIRDNIKTDQFLLHYQPQIDIKSRAICGVEALIRWNHPEKGWVPPQNFIPFAEHTKQIIPLTEQFLPEACIQAKKWQNMKLPPIKMSVNISPSHFHEKSFVGFVQQCCLDADLNPNMLELEITEGVIMSQTEEVISILNELSRIGVHLAIDDFGTGYSSLSYLRDLPIDKLKIDQAFIKNMVEDKSSLSLVEAIIKLGHSFNLKVIAEGVEEDEQLKKLLKLKCDQAQGYLISRPQNVEDITKWLVDNYS
jgi:diguanylate cyclase (GGDEF)-like protein